MIIVTRLDRQTMFLNPDHIVSMEETPDTVITMFNGHHILVREKCHVILNRIIAYRGKLSRRAGSAPAGRTYLRRQRSQSYHKISASQCLGITDPGDFLKPLHHQDY